MSNGASSDASRAGGRSGLSRWPALAAALWVVTLVVAACSGGETPQASDPAPVIASDQVDQTTGGSGGPTTTEAGQVQSDGRPVGALGLLAGIVIGGVIGGAIGFAVGRAPGQSDTIDGPPPARTEPPAGDAPQAGAQRDRLVRLLIDNRDRIDSPSIRLAIGRGLADVGVDEIAPAEGQPFDPLVHRVVQPVPTDEPARQSTIAALESPGYRTRDGALVREARVHVYQLGAHR